MLQPFAVSGVVLDAYRRYIRSSFPLRDPALDQAREELIDSRLLWAEPFVALARPGTEGPRIDSLTDQLAAATRGLPWGFEELFTHQRRAIERLIRSPHHAPENTLVLSGTGSGKTESFLIPIIDACLRQPGPGVRALLIYPMNALANDQLKRLNELLAGCPQVTYGRYTGDAPDTDAGDRRRSPRPPDSPPNLRWSRQAMRDDPPNLLLTNYTQLEYILLRGKDAEIFRHGAPWYVVVDEIHLFSGVLGAEVACLLRRLRQHVGVGPRDLAFVGTSATAGNQAERTRLLSFAGRFFGSPFADEAAIEEVATPLGEPGERVVDVPQLDDASLEAATDVAGLASLARLTLGEVLPADETFPRALGDVIDRYRAIGLVERALERPAALSTATQALRELPGRATLPEAALVREATALLLLGAAARLPPRGEREPQPRFRPRVHQVVRSLAGLWRCLDPECGRLVEPGTGRCPACGSLTLPLASCRTCGEAYWTSPRQGELADLGQLQAVDRRRGTDGIFLADPGRMASVIDEDEEGHRIEWTDLLVCRACGGTGLDEESVRHGRGCPNPQSSLAHYRASIDDVHCPACGHAGAAGRPILLSLHGSAAASVAVLTQSLSDELREREGEAGGRLLVFADSRQDAALQAGYADDQGAKVAVRQLMAAALASGPLSLPDLIRSVRAAVLDDEQVLRRWLIGYTDRDFARVAEPGYVPSEDDRKQVSRQIEWELLLDLTERARRRFAPEPEGVVTVQMEKLDELTQAVERAWPGHPFGSRERLASVIQAVADVARGDRAVDHWMLKLKPAELRRAHSVTIGDRAVRATRGYAENRFLARDVDLRGWTARRGQSRMAELVGRVLRRRLNEVNLAVEGLASRLKAAGVFTQSRVESRNRLMLDHKRLVASLPRAGELWRCDRCGAVRGACLEDTEGRALCTNWRCSGTPRRWIPRAERDFYRRQYLAEPRRFIVREHSGQIESEDRLALEVRFNDRAYPTVDVLACTPTLEVGVSLDDLHAVILRNLPPTPANYAQRVGRAGRRSKVALAIAHAGQGPHDSYYFEQPGELIAGTVRAPTFSLDNEPLLRRHVNSLVLETLGLDLPWAWVPAPGSPPEGAGPTIATADGVIREDALKPLADRLADPAWRARLTATVRLAFLHADDPQHPAEAERICEDQIEQFLPDLRRALNRWCDRYRALLAEYNRLRRSSGIPTQQEQEEERRLLLELERLAQPATPEFQPLGFLGLVGFLPRYGFVGTTTLLHLPQGEAPIGQSAWVAVTEYAPENLVYARGRKLKVRRLDPQPVPEAEAGAEHRENVLREGRRCDACEFLTFDPLVRACPECSQDLIRQPVVELTGVRASGNVITSEDEYRQREDYDVLQMLSGQARSSQVITLGGFQIERTTGREIIVANRGPWPEDHSAGRGFEICTGCGLALETRVPDEDEDDTPDLSGHSARCPARREGTDGVVRAGLWLTARLRGDVMELRLPEAVRGEGFESWRATLAEALKAGIRDVMEAGQRDVESFIRRQQGEPFSIVLYDTMPGGTGYLPKLFEDGAASLKQAAARALERLERCTCTSSCHRCLRDFWNQRVHHQLNRFEVMGALRRLAEDEATAGAEPEDERFDSFLEHEFYQRVRSAGLPLPTLQVVRELGGRRVIRVDAEYRHPDVSIYLDGRAYHAQTLEKIQDDLQVRNQLEARGVCVLEFTYRQVMDHFAEVAQTIGRALAPATAANEPLDPRSIPGLRVVAVNETQRKVSVEVDAAAWLASEAARAEALAGANALRLAGWRVERQTSRTGAE
ncbi:MAG: DEAD/DEAH box helicase [Myxococcota bacterium]|jgi:hypothetical protein|nr:DEAD/DEAH box helicase [Myxococcota bacterium]